MRIAVIGFGGVGKAFVELVHDKREVLEAEGINPVINYIVRSQGGIYNPQGIDIGDLLTFLKENQDITTYPQGGSKDISFERIMEEGDVDVVIEMTPTNLETAEPGLGFIRRSLEKGIHVVTANKGPILLAYKELYELAKNNGVQLGIGCTTGGALPSINSGVIDMAGSNITSIEGVLNGTTNFILEEMADKKIEYLEALKKAQDLGIAERDPSLDVEGWDTATKLLILTNVLMQEDKTLDDVDVQGIQSMTLADVEESLKYGKRYKLIGRSSLEDGQLKISVHPELVGPDNIFYNVNGKNKAVRYTSDTLGDLTIIGGASGVTPAAASILRDLINIHRGYSYIR